MKWSSIFRLPSKNSDGEQKNQEKRDENTAESPEFT